MYLYMCFVCFYTWLSDLIKYNINYINFLLNKDYYYLHLISSFYHTQTLTGLLFLQFFPNFIYTSIIQFSHEGYIYYI